MRRIFKYSFPVTDKFSMDLPLGGRILTVQDQHGTACMWVVFDDALKKNETREFRVIGTGRPIPDYDDLEYVATFKSLDGAFVWHLFEVDEMVEAKPNIESPEGTA